MVHCSHITQQLLQCLVEGPLPDWFAQKHDDIPLDCLSKRP